MSLEDKNIDRLFKDSLSERSFEASSAFLSDLERKLDAPKKKAAWWLWLLPILLLTSAYGGYSLFSSRTSSKSEYSSIVLERSESKTKDKYSNAVSAKNSSEITSTAYDASKNIDNSISENAQNSITNLKIESKLDESKEVTKTSSTKKPNSSVGVTDKGTKAHNTKKATIEKVLNKTNSSKTEDVDSQIDADRTATNIEKSIYIDTIKKEIITYKDSVIVRDSIVIRDSVVVKDSIVIKDSINIIEPANKGWFASIYGGFGKPKGTITGAGNIPQEILSGEVHKTTPDFGFEFGKRFGKVGISSGIGYSQYGELADFTVIDETQEDSIYLAATNVSFLYDTMGMITDTIFTYDYDTTTLTISQTYEHNENVSHNRILIPIRVGYRFDLGSSNWSIEPRAALNFELAVGNRSGKFPLWGETWLNYTTLNSWSYQFDVTIEKSFGNAYFSINPYYRGGVNTMIENQILFLERKYNSWGVRMGIGFKL